MTGNPMVEELNRLAGDFLASGGELQLPGVGSLREERRPARRLSRRMVRPSYREVSFSSQEQGTSLVSLIAQAVQCDQTQAEEIYGRWLSRVRTVNGLDIEEVGVLSFKNFTPYPSFDKRLNPQGREPVRIASGRRSDWVLWIGVAAIVFTVGAVGYFVIADSGFTQSGQTEIAWVELDVQAPAESVAEPAVDTAAVAVAAQPAQTQPVQVQRETAVQPQTAVPSVPSNDPQQPAELVAGHRYVVVGVFSTPENAARALKEAQAKAPAWKCTIYRFGGKYMLSAFETTGEAEGTKFLRDNANLFPDLWVYTAR